jgi:thymidylate synthase (FAD)
MLSAKTEGQEKCIHFSILAFNTTKTLRNMQVRLISVTSPLIQIDNQPLSPEGLIAYCARVSSPHQETTNYEKLLAYCIAHKHWSVFEMVDMTVEIVTSRAISPQILRHKSFQFQEFSQRYAKAQEIERYQPRRQDSKNRQNSLNDLDEETTTWFDEAQERIARLTLEAYNEALEKGIAKECARVLLPMATQTKLYMKGSVRSWIHYLEVRTDKSTQQEHQEIALEIKKIFMAQFPVTSAALAWS